MKTIINYISKYQLLIVISIGWVVYFQADNVFNNAVRNVKNQQVLGGSISENKESSLALSNELPILSIKSEGNHVEGENINENLFTVAMIEQKKLSREEVEIKPVFADHNKEAESFIMNRIRIDAVMSNGAIVNGRYYKRGNFIDINYISPTGEKFKARLVSTTGDSVGFDINGNRVAKKYVF
ncbi:hypothetical protein KW507_15830 [Vibrio fluvialis]|nr:hypothetical protein [Vibrio fluvialis]